VRAAIIKFVLLLGVLMMPFGMAPVNAGTAHQAMAGMPAGHCPEQSSGHERKAGIAECTMACAAALPAAVASADDPPVMVTCPCLALPSESLHGLHPDTATPPPKVS
jgi:hypothetical protein